MKNDAKYKISAVQLWGVQWEVLCIYVCATVTNRQVATVGEEWVLEMDTVWLIYSINALLWGGMGHTRVHHRWRVHFKWSNMQIQSHRRGATEGNCLWWLKKEKKYTTTAQEQLCFINIHILQYRPPQPWPLGRLSVSFRRPRPPLLLGLVRLVCREEGHAVGPEVGVEVRGLVESPAAHLAAQVSVSVLALCLRRTGSGRAIWRALGARGPAFRVALGVPHSVSDETVSAERAGRCKADSALQALEGGGVAPMLGDVALKLGPVFCSEPAGDTAENVIFLLCLTGSHWCWRHGCPGSLCGTAAILCVGFVLVSRSGRRRTDLTVLLRGAPRSFSPCGCTLPGHRGTLRKRESRG